MSKPPPTRMSNFPPKRGPTSMASTGPMANFSTKQQTIANRAYEIFLARGAQHGRDQEDWYQAERELMLGRQ